MLCELVFGGAFNNMSLEQLAATAACFVWQEKSAVSPKVQRLLLADEGDEVACC